MNYECFLQKCTVGSEREKDGPKSTGKVKEYGLTQERIVVPLITGRDLEWHTQEKDKRTKCFGRPII